VKNPTEETGIPLVECESSRNRTDEMRQLAAVMEIANAINSRTDLDQILAVISKELSKVIEYDLGCVAIYEKERNCLFMRHVWRASGEHTGEGRYVPFDESNLVGWVAIHRKPVVRGNIREDTRFREVMREDSLMSDIVVPLIANGELVGTVNVGSHTPGHFTDFDLDLLVRFSQLTAIAIEKSKVLEELEDLGERYRLLMRNANEIIVITTTAAEIVEVNSALYEMSGYLPEEVTGREIFDFMPPERREIAKQNFYAVLKGETTSMPGVPYLKKTGETVYLDMSVAKIRIKDHPYILAIAHDVTERKVLQERITQQNAELTAINQKLQELDNLKNEFLGRVSHELRTPLSIIMAYTDSLLEDPEQAIDPETRTEFLRVIEAHSNKLLGLINDLLDLSRVEVSDAMLHQSEGSLNEIVRISAKIAEALAVQSRVTLVTDLDETISIGTFDPLRIRQACVNLLTNAIKFSGKGDSVVIATRNGEREVVVSVRDHGPGIDAEDIPELFEKFIQLDGGASREREGLGIGLKLVRHYVELHGGKVWIESVKGAGSTFFFSLPK
jgi:PAS domain S-box-containing protein